MANTAVTRFIGGFRTINGDHLNRIVDYLNALIGVTGVAGIQGNFSSFVTMPQLPGGNIAAGGTAIGNAAALATGINFVTGANDTASVILPAGAAVGLSKLCWVRNTVANKVLPVFPPVGGTINGGSGNASISMGNGTGALFVSQTTTSWYTIPATAS